MHHAPSTCHPLTLTRSIPDFPIGNRKLSEHHATLVGNDDITVDPLAWVEPADYHAFQESGCDSMVNELTGETILWAGASADTSDAYTASDSFLLHYPWDLLRANENYVSFLKDDEIAGEVHPAASINGVVRMGEGSRILPGVVIEGNVVIGKGCKIGPNCYLRGNTSIGDSCHIGQSVEIKNSIILSNTNVGHLSYVGDSILGERVNFGAGTMVSNLRHDGSNHQSMVEEVLMDTGRRKFGTVIGDGVHTGIQTSIYPGRKMWPGTSTRPAQVVDKDIVQ